MGGYGAIRAALRNPSVFLGAASQSGFLSPKLFGDMFTQYREILNTQFPAIFDIFGPGTFSLDPTTNPPSFMVDGVYKLPTDPALAFNLSFVAANDPTVMVTPNGSPIPILLEVGSLEINNPAIFNGTKNFCKALAKSGSQGKVHLSSGDGTLSAWVLNSGAILDWLNKVLEGDNIDPIDCTPLI